VFFCFQFEAHKAKFVTQLTVNMMDYP
jgi:hypothetical protein